MKKRVVGELVTQSRLATALGITDRRVRQLAQLGVVVCEPAGGYDLRLNQYRYRLFLDRDVDRIAADVEQAAAEADEALKLMAGELDLTKRRALGRECGHVVGALNRAMKLLNATASPHAREMLETFTQMCVGRTAGDWMELCNLTLADEELEHEWSPVDCPG